MNITKQKQTHRYREQTRGYQWRQGSGKGQYRGKRVTGTNYQALNKLPGYIVQHGEYSQYFIITISGV